MTNTRFAQIYCCLCAFAFVGVLLDIALSQDVGVVAAVLTITLLGLPHGALDFSVAKSLKLIESPVSAGVFVFVYMLIALFSIATWVRFPALGLTVFMIISIYHFAADWRASMPSYAQLGLASIVLCGPSILYSDTVEQLFTALLLTTQTAEILVAVMQIGFAIGLVLFSGFLFGVFRSRKKIKRWALIEYGTLIISSLVLTPLLHFVLYFCVLHSPKHMTDVIKKLNFTVKQALIASLPFVAFSILVAFAFYYWFASGDLNNDLLRWVFIGLFGLTMSHMLLVSIWHRLSAS